MATVPPLPLSDIVDITVTIAPVAATANSFNQGLFIGSSTVIPSYGTNPRLRRYGAGGPAALAAMLTDGFTTNSPEYIAAQIVFSQTPPPTYLWIGRQDLTAIQTAIPHSGNAGTGYVVGDQITVVQGGASHGVLTVLAVTAGAVTSLGTTIGNQGTGYATATALATTGGTGTGLEVDITAIGETLLQAAEACRAANSVWYGLAVYNPVDADNLALAQWADPLWQTTRYYPWSSTAAIANGTTNNLFLQMQTLKLRVLPTYATTQSGLYPNNIYAGAAIMGVEMGLNTGLPGSFFNASHKQLAGIAVEPLTQTQAQNISNAGGNYYGNYAPYSMYEPGVMSNGDPSYLWLFLAMLVANMQIDELNVLVGNPVVTQTNADEQKLLQAANDACAYLNSIGFLADGTWQGVTFNLVGISLKTGQAIPNGYLNQAQPYSQQSSGDRAAGKAMPIICAITTAGAVRSLLIGVYAQL